MEGIRETSFGSCGKRSASLFATALLLLTFSGQVFAQAIPQKNINVIGPTPLNTWYVGDSFLQFNESDGACSPNNPRWCAIGMNDYRGVNDPVLGDAFPGIAMTRGDTWISGLHPGNLADAQNINQKFGADPNLEAVPGMLFYNFIAGWRDDSQPGGVYLSRWYEHNREVGPPWQYKDTLQVEMGTSGRFLDKPAFKIAYLEPGTPDITIQIPALLDPSDNFTLLHDEFALTIPAIRMHLCYAVFVGNDNNDGTKINCLASDDGGVTWPIKSKLTESVDINQGVTLATRNFGQDVLACWLRFRDNNDDDAIVCAFSSNGAQTWSKPEVVTEFCPFNQGTGPARHRSNALPVAVSNDNEFAVYFASRNTPTGNNDTCVIPAKGNKDPAIQMSNVAYKDDFDSFSEGFDDDGVRIKDGQIRTSLNFSRIMMMRSANPGSPNSWSAAKAVDPQLNDAAECPQISSSGSNPAACRKNSHQYMPAGFAAGGIETVAWYDTRMDRLNRLPNPINSGYVEDVVVRLEGENFDENGAPIPPWTSAMLLPAGIYELEPPPTNVPPPGNNIPLRRNIDVFAAQIENGLPRQYTVDPNTYYPSILATEPSPSVRVTQFATRIKRDDNGAVVTKTVNGITVPETEQLEYNFPNARMFNKGTRPFIGDYNTVFAVNARLQDGNWVSNQSAIKNLPTNDLNATLFPSLEPAFHIGWTTNRDVRGKVFYTGCDKWDETLQMWLSDECVPSGYVTPSAPPMPTGAMAPLQGEGGDSPAEAGVCLADIGNAQNLRSSNKGPLTRNQKIYTAKLKPGINVEVLSAVKDRSNPNGSGVPLNTFVLGVQNGTNGARRVRIELPLAETVISFERNTFVPPDGQQAADPKLFIDAVIPAGSSNVRTVFDAAGNLDNNIIVSVYDVTLVDREDPDNPGQLIDSQPGTGVLVARVPLERSSVLPLEPLVAYDPDNLPVDITEEDFFRLLLSRETSAEKTLAFENLSFENLSFENLSFENKVKLLEFENSAELLAFENLSFENSLVFLDFENLAFENIFVSNANLTDDSYSLLDFENLSFENNVTLLDFENLSFENRTMYSDLESLSFENTFIEALAFENLAFENLSFENLSFENLSFENLAFQNLAFENLAFENLSFENTALFSSSVDNSDLRNLTLDSNDIGKQSVEVSWKVASDGNTTTGVDVKPIFSPALKSELDASGTKVLLSVRQLYYTPTVSLTADSTSFCSAQIIAQNQVVYSAILSPEQINSFFNDPNADEATTPGFQLDPKVENIITLQLINPPANFNSTEKLSTGVGMAVFAQGATTQNCDESVEVEQGIYDACEIDAPPPDAEAPVITLNAGSNSFDEGTDYVDPGATASDNVDADFAATATITGYTNVAPGSFTIEYNATDSAGNAADPVIRTVTVNDKTAPVITLVGLPSQTLEAGSDTYTEEGATAFDNVDGILGVTIGGDVVIDDVPNIYSVTYNAVDSAGNAAVPVTRTVTVADTGAPIIIIDPDLFEPDAPYVVPAGSPADAIFPVSWPVGAQDPTNLSFSCSVDGSATPLVPQGEPSYDPATGTLTQNYSYDFPIGTTSVTCMVTDEGGNVTSATFTVLVEDYPTITVDQDPVPVTTDDDGGTTATVFEADLIALLTVNDFITDPADLTVSCLGDVSAEFAIGSHEVTCTVTDTATPPNSASVTFTLDVGYRYDVKFALPKGRLQAGSTLPIDFYYEDNGTRIDASTFAPTASWIGPFDAPGCAADAGSVPGTGEDSGSSDFRWSASQQIWQFSWQTPAEPGQYLFTISPPGTAASTTDPICLK